MKKIVCMILILVCVCTGCSFNDIPVKIEQELERKHYAETLYMQWKEPDEVIELDTAYTKGKYLYIGIDFKFKEKVVVSKSGLYGTAEVDGTSAIVNILDEDQQKFEEGDVLRGATYLLFKINIKQTEDNEPQNITCKIQAENRVLWFNFRLDW